MKSAHSSLRLVGAFQTKKYSRIRHVRFVPAVGAESTFSCVSSLWHWELPCSYFSTPSFAVYATLLVS